MRLKYIKDLCFAFLYHCPVEVSKRLGNLLPRSMQDKWQQLLEMGTTKVLGTWPGKEKSSRNPHWLHGDMLLGWVFYSRTPREGGKRGAAKLYVFCERPWSCLHACPASYKWVMGVSKSHGVMSLLGMWLGISKKVALQKLWDPEASVLVSAVRFVTRISPEPRPAPLPAPTPASSGARGRYIGEKGYAQSAPSLRIMSQPLASSRLRNFLTRWLCLDHHD